MLTGQQIQQQDGDSELAIAKFFLGIKVFEAQVKENNYDEKMVNNFCNLLIMFLKVIPKIHNEKNILYVRQLLVRYQSILSFSNSLRQIEFLLDDIYNVRLSGYQPSCKGKVTNFKPMHNYAFILSDDGNRYYVNKKEFKLFEWNTLRNDDKVGFDIGTNNLGECAINVIKL